MLATKRFSKRVALYTSHAVFGCPLWHTLTHTFVQVLTHWVYDCFHLVSNILFFIIIILWQVGKLCLFYMWIWTFLKIIARKTFVVTFQQLIEVPFTSVNMFTSLYVFVSFVSVHTTYTCIKCSVINYRTSHRTDILDSARPDYIRVSWWNGELTQAGTYMSKSRQSNSMCTACNMKQLESWNSARIISRHPTAMISGNWFIEDNF